MGTVVAFFIGLFLGWFVALLSVAATLSDELEGDDFDR